MTSKEFVYPGSFDPLTMGHLDIAVRASKLCEKLHVVILENKSKIPAFSVEERVLMTERCLKQYENIVVRSFSGLLVDFLRQNGLRVVIRGLRSESDFRFETEMVATNKLMYPEYETILLASKTEYSYTSSSMVREIASYGGDISKMVPAEILDQVRARYTGTIGPA